MWRVGILSCSDRGSRGERVDESKNLITQMITKEFKGEVVSYRCVPDEFEIIKETLIEMIDWDKADVILTTGGTGLSPRDVTPEATLDVIDRVIPGFAEEMRRKAMESSRNAIFTRAVVGTRKTTLIINLPGSPSAAILCLGSILDQIEPALQLLTGKKEEV